MLPRFMAQVYGDLSLILQQTNQISKIFVMYHFWFTFLSLSFILTCAEYFACCEETHPGFWLSQRNGLRRCEIAYISQGTQNDHRTYSF
uniref:Uncharacterized protein n=1 Tax=Rhizophora mucronata TaxID=61149 RepID=A0A2P2NRP0_RHIMU